MLRICSGPTFKSLHALPSVFSRISSGQIVPGSPGDHTFILQGALTWLVSYLLVENRTHLPSSVQEPSKNVTFLPPPSSPQQAKLPSGRVHPAWPQLTSVSPRATTLQSKVWHFFPPLPMLNSWFSLRLRNRYPRDCAPQVPRQRPQVPNANTSVGAVLSPAFQHMEWRAASGLQWLRTGGQSGSQSSLWQSLSCLVKDWCVCMHLMLLNSIALPIRKVSFCHGRRALAYSISSSSKAAGKCTDRRSFTTLGHRPEGWFSIMTTCCNHQKHFLKYWGL